MTKCLDCGVEVYKDGAGKLAEERRKEVKTFEGSDRRQPPSGEGGGGQQRPPERRHPLNRRLWGKSA